MAYISGNSAAFFAFNIWDTESARAVIDAGEAMGRDVILQTDRQGAVRGRWGMF